MLPLAAVGLATSLCFHVFICDMGMVIMSSKQDWVAWIPQEHKIN